MTCSRCGKFYNSGDRFCGFCGYNLNVSDTNFVTLHDLNAQDVQFDLGLLYFKEGKYQDALEIFERMKKKKPDDLQVMNMYERTREALKEC